jgi:hypothetical protein
VFLVIGSAGCPPDDGSNPGSDEVGDGDGDPDGSGIAPPPINPLVGEASPGCGYSPHPEWIATRPPSSLGSGLVHDSRLGLDPSRSAVRVKNSATPATAQWAKFAHHSQAMTRVGFRPAQLRVDVSVSPISVSESRVEIRDHSIYISDDDANYRTEVETHVRHRRRRALRDSVRAG